MTPESVTTEMCYRMHAMERETRLAQSQRVDELLVMLQVQMTTAAEERQALATQLATVVHHMALLPEKLGNLERRLASAGEVRIPPKVILGIILGLLSLATGIKFGLDALF